MCDNYQQSKMTNLNECPVLGQRTVWITIYWKIYNSTVYSYRKLWRKWQKKK